MTAFISQPPWGKGGTRETAESGHNVGYPVGYSGNILANWKASSSKVWTVPIGVAVGKVMKLKVQLAGQYMPIPPNSDGQEWNIQVQVTPVIPKLVKEPLRR